MTTSITRQELQSSMAAGDVTVVDALPAAPYARRHLPGALNLTHEDAESNAADVLPDREAAIVTYSTDDSCGRGEQLAERLTALGYRNVRVYRAGIEDWAAAGLPLAA